MKASLCLILTLLLWITYGTAIAAPPEVGPISVTVENTESNPVPVKVLNQTPFYGVYQVYAIPNSVLGCEEFVTPEDSLLIIENISCAGNTNLFQRIKCEVRVFPDPEDPCLAIQFASNFMMPVDDSGTFKFFSWVQPLKLYAPPGSLVRVCGGKAEQFDSSASFDISLTGYYEPY